jgi:hypothetical protein
MAKRWKRRPDGSNWGEFGEDDQFGRLNLLTPEVVRRAAAEVKEGLSFCLSLPLTLPGHNRINPRRFPPQLRPNEREGRPMVNLPFKLFEPDAIDVVCDDVVLLWTQYSTQWDSFAHIGQLFDADGDGVPEVVYYNGFRGGEHVRGPQDYLAGSATGHTYAGTAALGIHLLAEKPVQGRGVLLDLKHHYGTAHRFAGHDDVMRVLEADNATVETGDILCLHTGYAERVVEMAGEPDAAELAGSFAALDGRDDRLLRWIADAGIVAIVADNYAVEAMPSRAGHGSCAMLPLHELCLFKLGIPLGELWYFSALAAWLRQAGRSRFMLTAPALRLPGAVGSPVTPVATV